MARYIHLISWTDQGVRGYADTVKRAAAAADMFAALGGRMVELYWTLGPYDIVVISEFPDDDTATAAALRTSAQGNVRTTTMRAFDRQEIGAIVTKARG